MDMAPDLSHLSMDRDRIFADQVRKLYDQTVVGTVGTMANSIILVFVLKSHIAPVTLIVWLILAVLVSAGRLTVHWHYRKSPTQSSNPRFWYTWFVVTLFAAGILWGSTAIFLFPADAIGHQAFIAFVSGGMVAGAVGAFTAVLGAFFIFSLPALLPVVAHFFLLGGEIHIAMGTMVFLFLVLTSLTARRMHRQIIHLLTLRYERSGLIENLQNEVYQRKQAQDELRREKEQVEETVARRTTQLKSANQRLQAILNYAPLAIWATDHQGVLTFCDGKGLETIGFGPDWAVGQSVCDLFSEDAPFTDITRRVLAGEFISESIRLNGVWFEVRYQPVMAAGNRLTGAIGIAIDVTEQTVAKEALRISEEKHRDLVENINDVIYAIDPEGVITYVSPVIERVLGYRADGLVGKNFLDYIFLDDRDRVRHDFTRALKVVGSHGEYRFNHSTGAIKWFRVSSRPAMEAEALIGIQGVLVDITRSKRLEEQLQRSQKMEALGTMAGGVAHDLNNILSGIVSYPELLLMDMPQESPLWRPLKTIKQSGENAAAIVQDLLTLARRGVPTLELLNLNQMVQKCLGTSEIRSLLEAHPEITIITSLPPDLLNFYGSSIHVLKSISNLIFNAVEAISNGGQIEIATGNRYADKLLFGFDTVKEGEYVVLSIADTGVGIPESDQARIFEPFYTNKTMGRGGSGLGMAVVWGTIKDHHGYIDLRSQEGRGTRFDLLFPATRDRMGKPHDPEAVMDFAGRGEVVLVVDDMPVQREIATGILSRLGYHAEAVASGEEAIEFFRHKRADLVILDMIMEPGMDGYETFCEIQKIQPGQKAIIASGYSETQRVRQTQALGAGRYIKKPYTLVDIGRLVKEELKK